MHAQQFIPILIESQWNLKMNLVNGQVKSATPY